MYWHFPYPCYKCNIKKYLIPVLPFPFVFLTLTTVVIYPVPVLSIIGPVALIFISIYIKIAPLATFNPVYKSPFISLAVLKYIRPRAIKFVIQPVSDVFVLVSVVVDTFAISFIVKYLSFVTTAIHIVFYLNIFPEFAFLVVDIS